MLDITAQKQAELASAESEARLRSLIQQSPMAIGLLKGEGMVIELGNEKLFELWGKDASIIGKQFLGALPELEGQAFVNLLQRVYQTGEPYEGQAIRTSVKRQGQLEDAYFDFTYTPLRETNGSISGVMVLAVEVTPQVIARNKIEASELRFRTLLETITPMTWTGIPTGEVTFFNQRWYDYTGLSFEQTKDWGWTRAVHPEDLPRMLATFEQVKETGEAFIADIRYRGADGQYRWFLNRAFPLRDQSGRITLWVGTATDIQDQKSQTERLEQLVTNRTQDLRLANANLERSNFDLMQFASLASHDLKEPLRKIQAFGSLLQSTAMEKLDERERDYLGRVINSAQRMQALVEDVLNLSKLSHQSMPFSETDLAQVVYRIIDDLSVQISERNARIQVGALPRIEANAGQMHQLFQNLISNALKFNQSPTPTVCIEEVPLSSQQTSAVDIDADAYVCLQVRDNGIGFDEAYQEKIFGIFQRLHGKLQYEGTGMGLAICKRIVGNHHGFIRAEGKVNQGAMIEIILPRHQESAKE